MALVLHNLNGALRGAVAKLVDLIDKQKDENILRKLEPMRAGGWTWNGNINYHPRVGGTQEDTPSIELKGLKPFSLEDSVKENAPPGRMHCVLFLKDIPSSSMSTSPMVREKLLSAVHLSIISLWRSKVNSERIRVNRDGLESPHQKQARPMIHTIVEYLPMMTIIFSDNVRLTFNRDMLLKYMAEKHMAAPCEFQVIMAMTQLGKGMCSMETENVTGSQSVQPMKKTRMKRACSRPLSSLLNEFHDPQSTKIIQVLLDDNWSTADDKFLDDIYRSNYVENDQGKYATGREDLVLLFDGGPAWSIQQEVRSFFRCWRVDHVFAWVRVLPEKFFCRQESIDAIEEEYATSIDRMEEKSYKEDFCCKSFWTSDETFPSFALAAFQNWQSAGVLGHALQKLFQAKEKKRKRDSEEQNRI